MSELRDSVLPKSINQLSAYSVARKAAIEAGSILKKRFGQQNAVQIKGKRNIVTEADLLSEARTIEMLSSEFPHHGILSEEAGDRRSNSDYTWIIDPLDGTNNYSFGIPFFCVNIALARSGKVVMGITYDPMRGEMFHAIAGKGAYLNGRKIRVSAVTSLDRASVGLDLGYNPERSAEMLNIASKLWSNVYCLRLLGSSSLGVAYVACGRLGLYFHKYLYPWDIASGLVLVSEAGGKVIGFDGRAATYKENEIIASNTRLIGLFTKWLRAE